MGHDQRDRQRAMGFGHSFAVYCVQPGKARQSSGVLGLVPRIGNLSALVPTSLRNGTLTWTEPETEGTEVTEDRRVKEG